MRNPTRRHLAVAATAAALVAIAAPAWADDERFNVKAARRAIGTELRRTYPELVVGPVKCPKEVVARRGRRFRCTTTVAGTRLTVLGQVGRGRDYTVETVGIVVSKAAAEAAVTARASLPPAAVDCGPTLAHVLGVGGRIPCSATFGDGSKQDVVVVVASTAGQLLVDSP
jgi:hypothetical protein